MIYFYNICPSQKNRDPPGAWSNNCGPPKNYGPSLNQNKRGSVYKQHHQHDNDVIELS